MNLSDSMYALIFGKASNLSKKAFRLVVSLKIAGSRMRCWSNSSYMMKSGKVIYNSIDTGVRLFVLNKKTEQKAPECLYGDKNEIMACPPHRPRTSSCLQGIWRSAVRLPWHSQRSCLVFPPSKLNRDRNQSSPPAEQNDSSQSVPKKKDVEPWIATYKIRRWKNFQRDIVENLGLNG